MTELHLLRPLWLLGLIPLAALWWALWLRQDARGRLDRMIDPRLLPHLLVGAEAGRRLRPIHLLALVWVLTILALAGPTWEREPSPFSDDDAGLMVLLEVSATMQATDVQPTRLARSKQKLRDLLALREGQSTGLIVYSGSAHLVMPLTRDGRIITAMIEDLTPELMPVDGDALSEALTLADRFLRRAEVAGSVLVIADGVAPAQADRINGDGFALPVQFLSVRAPGAGEDPGLRRAAAALDAGVTRLTVDRRDAEQIAARARTRLRSVAGEATSERWRDAGYWTLPLIALLALFWSRPGWVVR